MSAFSHTEVVDIEVAVAVETAGVYGDRKRIVGDKNERTRIAAVPCRVDIVHRVSLVEEIFGKACPHTEVVHIYSCAQHDTELSA